VTSLLLAYLDPGTGSIVLQFIIGGILGLALTLKIFWRRIVSMFTGKKNTSEEVESGDQPEE